MFCPNCGKQLPEGSAFCGACGAKLDAAPPVQPPPQQASIQPQNKKAPRAAIIGVILVLVALATALFILPGVLRREPVNVHREESPKPTEQTVPTPAQPSDVGISSGSGDVLPRQDQPEAAEPPVQEPRSGGASDSAASVAAFYSTDEDAAALEFDWFLDLVLSDGAVFQEMFIDAEDVTDPALLEGGWKAYMRGNGENENDTERYLHAELQSMDGNGKLTLRWHAVFFPSEGQSFAEEGSDTFSGNWKDGQLTAVGPGSVKLDRFFAAKGKQYGYGTFLWPSGEVDYIALMRP